MKKTVPYTKNFFSILKKLDIKHFFYIGGNDSMDTIKKLAEYANKINSDITFMGVPKQSTTTLTKPTIHRVTEVRQNTLHPQ